LRAYLCPNDLDGCDRSVPQFYAAFLSFLSVRPI
jgi:hypothetical protein